MNFKQLVAKYAFGALSPDKISEFALIGFSEGFESPSLLVLAGFDKNESLFEIEKYFKLAMAELEIKVPDRRTAAIYYANGIAEEVIEGKRDIISGIRAIKNILDDYGFYSENIAYVYDSIYFEKVYGLYDTYDDLEETNIEQDPNKSNHVLMAETKIELREELKYWSEKIKMHFNL